MIIPKINETIDPMRTSQPAILSNCFAFGMIFHFSVDVAAAECGGASIPAYPLKKLRTIAKSLLCESGGGIAPKTQRRPPQPEWYPSVFALLGKARAADHNEQEPAGAPSA
jgi:hypothetical protein